MARSPSFPWEEKGGDPAATAFVAGLRNRLRCLSTSSRNAQPSTWSFTRPMACENAYIVVGPTKRHPRFFRSRERALDSGEVVMARSASRVMRFGRVAGSGS